MKPTKMRNSQLYRATYATRSSQVSSPLSKDLQKKYAKKSVRVVEGDTVKVVRGEYKGVDGKIAQVEAATSKVTVEGIKKEKTRGDKYDVFIHTSNLVVTDLNTDDQWRVKKLKGEKGVPSKPAATEDKSKAVEKKSEPKAEEKKPEPKQTKAKEKVEETEE